MVLSAKTRSVSRMPTTLHIRLTPKASANKIGEKRMGSHGVEQLVVYVTAPPDKNKANEALIDLLSDHLHISKSKISITRGHTDRNKVIQILD